MSETRPLSASFVAEVAGLDVRGPIDAAVTDALQSEDAPVSWTPDDLCSRGPRWARQGERIRQSSVAR
jgi:hypothetical protein